MTKRAAHLDNDEGGPTSSPWRLVNLSLGISAVLGILGGGASLLTQLPSRWILGFWYSRSSLDTVPLWIKTAAQIGLNLWLPASALVLLLIACGFGRKLDAPRPRFSAALWIVWLTYAALLIALNLLHAEFGGSEASGAIGMMVGLVTWPIVAVLFIVGVWAAVAELSAMFRFRDAVYFSRVSKSWVLWALSPPILFVLPLLFAPSRPLALASHQSSEFETLCATTGVRFMGAPAGPVRSIAYDWDPERMERPFGFITVDKRGDFASGRGSWGGPGRIEKGRETFTFDFIESREDGWCHFRSEQPTPYAHCPSVRSNIESKAPYYGIDTFTADVLANYEVDRLDAKLSSLNHGPVRFKITLTDRRSGVVLGEMAYVVDRANKRACGVNFGNEISLDAFIWDAINR